MAVREIIKMGHPHLRRVAKEMDLNEIKSEETRLLLQDMEETMKFHQGIGLAAPQIDIDLQLAIIQIPNHSERYPEAQKIAGENNKFVIINPRISILDPTVLGMWEGCLSVPGLRAYIERPKKINVQFFNENAEEKNLKLEGLLAIVFQHELDHLFGKLFLDRLQDPTLMAFHDEYQKFHLVNNEKSSKLKD